jgi:transcriptional regulator with XRE-family HTH domain
MTSTWSDSAVERRRLRIELRHLRQDKGLTQEQVATAMEWSTAKLLRIESGAVSIGVSDLKVLLDYYDVAAAKKSDLLETGRLARKDSWTEFRDVHTPGFLKFLGFESSSARIRNYELAAMPGLVQTEEYALAHQIGTYAVPADRAERRWEARQRRQGLHDRKDPPPPRMFFLVDEAVIRRQVGGPGVMKHQLERLLEFSQMQHITIQVVPFTAGANPGSMGPFILLDFDDARDDDLLFREYGSEGTMIEDDPEVTGPYIDWFFTIQKQACTEEETLSLLEAAIQDLNETTAADL